MVMKLLVAAVLALATLVGGLAPATAGEVLRPTVLTPNPFAMTPPPAPLEPRPAAPVVRAPEIRPHRPAPLVIYPCCSTGHWAYQWVPALYTTYVWVPGYVTSDGLMVDGSYQPRMVPGGYYQPVWVSE